MTSVLVTGSSGLIGPEVTTCSHNMGLIVHGIDKEVLSIVEDDFFQGVPHLPSVLPPVLPRSVVRREQRILTGALWG
jgi:hypothetical protein